MSSWLNADGICLWPNYTNQLNINKAIAQLEVPSPTWSEHAVLCTFGTAKTHKDGMVKLKLAEKISDIDTAASDEEKSTGKRGRHLRAKRCIIDSDSDDMAALPPKKKLAPFPKMPKDFGLFESAAETQQPAEERDEGHFVENSEDECRTNVTIASSSMRIKDTIGLGKSSNYTDNAVLEANATSSSKSASKKYTPCSKIVATPQSRTSNESQAAPRESSSNRRIQKIDNPSVESEMSSVTGKLKEILKEVIKIKYQLATIEEKLDDKMAQNISDDDDATWKELQDNDFPLKTQEALEKFEVALKNKTYLSKMTIGGFPANASIVNILKYTLSDLVAKEYSWSGARKKESFGELNTCRMLMKTVHSAFSTITNDEIKAVILKWLVQATLRYTRQTEKSERAAEKKVSSEKEKDAPTE